MIRKQSPKVNSMRYSTTILSLYLLISSSYSPPIYSLELFGINIETTNRNLLRSAIKQAGAKLIREGGLSNFYDIYESNKLFENSERLYTGFIKENGNFAFLEYQFPTQYHHTIQQKLESKYGPAEYNKGIFLTDSTLRWNIENILITLYTDFYKNKSLLIYEVPENRAKLNTEFNQQRIQDSSFY